MTRSYRHRGTILITAMWVLVVLGAMVLVFARSMRVELIASGNRLNQQKASAIELGAEQFILSQVDGSQGDSDFVMSIDGEARQVGDGYFWLLRPSDDEQTYQFGITDEAAKLNLNTAVEQQFMMLPNMTQYIADSIINWRDTSGKVTGQGASSQYYASLQEPYRAKAQPYESVEELKLVAGVTPDILYGIDRNHNGVTEPGEQAQGGSGSQSSTGVSANRGIYPFVTVYSVEPNADANGTARVNVNPTQGAGGAPGATVQTTVTQNGGTVQTVTQGGAGGSQSGGKSSSSSSSSSARTLQQVLQKAGISANRITDITNRAQRGGFANIFDFAQKTGMTSQDLRLVADEITTSPSKTTEGLINVNTASRAVLLTLPNIQEADVDALIGQRQTADTTSIAWVSDAIGLQKAAQIGQYITIHSYQYSADIVAVSGDGRAFKRVRIVVDVQQSPPTIIYRKDLTSLGWPLDPQVRQGLRSGKPVSGFVTGNTGSSKMGARS